jgi:hypothetical protein
MNIFVSEAGVMLHLLYKGEDQPDTKNANREKSRTPAMYNDMKERSLSSFP